MTASVFDHPFLSGLLGDEEIGAQFSAAAELSAMLRFEVALAEAEAAEGVVPVEAAKAIAALPEAFLADLDALKQAIGRDGVVIPDLVRQWRAMLGDQGRHLHFGATSQDAIDTGLMLRLGAVLSILGQRLMAIISSLEGLEQRLGTQSLMGRTRMQAAIPITVSDRLSSWKGPVVAHRATLQDMLKTGLPLQFGGAAGTLDKLGDKAPVVRARLSDLLQLSDRPQWHSQRATIAEIGGLFSQITGGLGKIGQDLALMADNGTALIGGGGASSAMPHKRNPVKAEVLVTLARFNAVQISGLHQSLVHEQERSGAAWTLEWMILPQMAIATGVATRLSTEILQSIEELGER